MGATLNLKLLKLLNLASISVSCSHDMRYSFTPVFSDYSQAVPLRSVLYHGPRAKWEGSAMFNSCRGLHGCGGCPAIPHHRRICAYVNAQAVGKQGNEFRLTRDLGAACTYHFVPS